MPWTHKLRKVDSSSLAKLVALKDKHPDVFTEFMAGNLTVKKTTHVFSALAIDQAHEQNKTSLKRDGRAVGLTNNAAASQC